jgi:hypothetical protein
MSDADRWRGDEEHLVRLAWGKAARVVRSHSSRVKDRELRELLELVAKLIENQSAAAFLNDLEMP